MTPEKAEKIFDKVLKEKEKLNLVSTSKKEKEIEVLHNGMNENVSNFLDKYHNEKDSCMNEIKAKQLLEAVSDEVK